jgi:hypothetical protein
VAAISKRRRTDAMDRFILETEAVPEPDDARLVHSCLRRICSWRVPPNWSVHDWFREMRTDSDAAMWQAKSDYDPGRGVPLEAFERLRVIASAWTRYRQEWSYALHCPTECDLDEEERAIDAAEAWGPVVDPVREALAQVSETDRWLLEQLFWAERSEAAVAQELGVSQQAVSKRRAAVLRKLRGLLGNATKEVGKIEAEWL